MKKQNKRMTIVFLLAVISILFTGCGEEKKNTNISDGMAAVQTSDYNNALQCFDKAMAGGENLRLLYRGQGLAYMGLTQYEEAIVSFEKALGSGNGRPDDMDYDINYYLAAAYHKLGQTDKSIEAYNAIIDLNKKDNMAYYLRGCLRLDENFDKAKADFDKAISIVPADYNQLIDIYCTLEANGYKEAGQEYLKAAVESESKTMTDYERGRMYYYLGDLDNSRNFLEKARETDQYQAILFLGKTYEELEDFSYAVSVYNSFIEKDQTNAEIYNQLGLCKNKMGAYEEALAAFQAGMKVEKCSIMQTLKFNEIATYENLGEFKKASVLMGNYLSSYPDDEKAKREYLFLKTR